jgi:hypothetical protein
MGTQTTINLLLTASLGLMLALAAWGWLGERRKGTP